jgi:hypothetical protein
MPADGPDSQLYLVRHDYGMGALWWWIRAESKAQILATFAEVEVVDDLAAISLAWSWRLEELDLSDAVRGPLASFYRTREQQRRDPAFGKLLGKSRVYLRLEDPDVDPGVWFSEHDAAGRRIRQVEIRPDGTAVATTTTDWPMNPPFDLGDPWLASNEITHDEFEQAWQQATKNTK